MHFAKQWHHSSMMQPANQPIPGQSIELSGVTKQWGETVALKQIDLSVAPGTFSVLLGPSGCGKSTTLRIIAGLESATTGNVTIANRDVTLLPPSQRDIAMVFQSYALFPHLSVAENILFGLKVRRTPKKQQQERLQHTAEVLGLTPYLSRKPSQLSGGQQQRVALGRAIIAEKPICLMDEPLSNLDAKLRNSMRMEIRELQQTLGFSMVYVTHDQAEAITMADQVVLMQDGEIAQAGTPREIYQQPATTFVAGFIGTPPMNLIAAEDALQACDSGQGMEFLQGMQQSLNANAQAPDDLVIGVRPEHINAENHAAINAKILGMEYLGSDLLVTCQVGQSTLLARVPGTTEISADETLQLAWTAESTTWFNRSSGARITL